MCGIAGVVTNSWSSVELESQLQKMIQVQAHRGPDAEGVYLGQGYGLGHVRLSIQDLSSAANQPMTCEDDQLIMVFNGEIYNYPDLRAQLLELDYQFTSTGDAEVLIKAFREWGAAVFQRLNGFFAAAFVDKQTQRLTLVRDRLGIKPLHFIRGDGYLAFASEIKALLLLKDDHSVAPQALAEYLYFGNALGANTLYANIERVLPGEYWEIDLIDGAIEKHVYWAVPRHSPSKPKAKHASGGVVEKTRALLSNAVQRQLISDVPIGISLSGGIDSTAITAFAAQHAPGQIDTFSIGFDFAGANDELAVAGRTAERLNTRHQELVVTNQKIADVVEQLGRSFDEPFADAANIPLYLLYQEIQGQYKVVLQGDGGDELFAGYPRYKTLRNINRLSLLGAPARGLARRLPASAWQQRLFRYACILAEEDPGIRMARLLTVDHPESACEPMSLLNDEYRQYLAGTDPFQRYSELATHSPALEATQMMLMTDLQVILPDIFLTKVDRAAMALGIEARVPFLDTELVDYVSSLPADQKMLGGQQKGLLKLALRGIVPDEVLDAPKKGFGAPYGYWLKAALKDIFIDVISSRQSAGMLDTQKVLNLYQEHCSAVRNWDFLLWKCLQLGLWLQRTALDRDKPISINR